MVGLLNDIDYQFILANGDDLETLSVSFAFQLMDFCGSRTTELTTEPTDEPLTMEPTDEPLTMEPTDEPTPESTFSERDIISAVLDCRDDIETLIDQNEELIGQVSYTHTHTHTQCLFSLIVITGLV
jgi:hypothetical protein